MSTRVGINGFGRIGRLVLRAALDAKIDVVAVNDLADASMLGHLFKYDSVHGRYRDEVNVDGDDLTVGAKTIKVLSTPDPVNLPWGDLGVDIVIESTGRFRERSLAATHLTSGASKVLITAPAKGEDVTIVLGVNDEALKSEHRIVSNASCTTNCLAPMAAVLHRNFVIEKGLMNTIHSYTGDQRIVDFQHKDPRRARSAALSMIPTTTGAAVAVGKVLPDLDGRLDGLSVRVPTPNGSLTDLTAQLGRDVTVQEVNAAFLDAATKCSLSPYLEYTEEPIVLADIVGNPASCIFDALTTNVVGGNLVKVLGWYDNEWGYANRCVELAERMG